MKKGYMSPELDIEKFNTPNSLITTSGQGSGDGEIGLEF